MRRARTTRETEIKLRIADLPGIIRKLRGLGAVSRGRVLERNTLYDTSGADLRRRGCLLRIREESPAPAAPIGAGKRRLIITAKAPAAASGRGRYKEKLEREIVMRARRDWPLAMRHVGLRPGFRYEKYRTTFRLPGLHLDLHETPVGVFLELEGSPRAIDRTAHDLGFDSSDYIRGTYWDLNAADCRRRGIPLRDMIF